MKNKLSRFKFLLLISLFFIILINSVKANSIQNHDNGGNLQIVRWDENDIINNLDLVVDATFELKIIKDLNSPKKLSLTFGPDEFVSSNPNKKPAEDFYVRICDGWHCNNSTNSAATFYPIGTKFPKYIINISQVDLEWDSDRTEDLFYLKIKYRISNYVNSENVIPLIPIDSDKTLVIGTGCISSSNDCPKPTNIRKAIILPNKTILKGYTEDGDTLHTRDGRIGICWNDFTKKEDKKEYKTLLVQYTDLKAEKSLFWISLFLSALSGAMIAILIEKPFKRFWKFVKKII